MRFETDSDIIGAIDDENEQDIYNTKWEDLEDHLGRAAFGDLFAHLRMIHRKQKMRGTLEREFRESISPTERPKQFIDDELRPSAEVFERILEPDPTHATRYQLLKGLHQLDNQDWQPPAIKFMVDHFDDNERIDLFLRRLDRLAYFLFITRADVNRRLLRYAALLGEIEAGTALTAGQAFELSSQEVSDLRTVLDGDVYLNQRTCRPILLRLDGMLSDGTAHYDHKLVTIEHVLPQTPQASSQWVTDFPDQELRTRWVHRLANLVLLSKYKNPAASNFDFDYKKEKYFSKDGDSSFVLTNQVRKERVWTPSVLESRQKALVDRMFNVWRVL